MGIFRKEGMCMDSSIYLARQPIFDERGEIFAYELLYRNTESNSAEVNDNLHATSRVLVNTLNYIGLSVLTYGLKAFVKVDETFLMDDIVYTISPAYFVLEILESTNMTPELTDRIYALHIKGYHFALNHYSSEKDFIRHFHSVLEVVDYVKIDISHSVRPDEIISSLREYKCKVIAEKIEDEATFAWAKSYEFHYFQGYYFCVPDLLSKANFDPDKILLYDLMYLLKTQASLDEILVKFNTSPYLVINLLKFVQMNGVLEHNSISSVEQALFLIGRERLSFWLELMYYANEKSGATEYSKEALQINQQVLQRAYLMKELAYSMKKNTHFADMAYLTGILSISDIMFQESCTKLMEQITIAHDIANALLCQKGVLGRILELVIAIEKNDLLLVSANIMELDLSEQELNTCLLNSYKKSSAAIQTKQH